MAKYELEDKQAKMLRDMLNNATIKGGDAMTVIGLLKALSEPSKKG